MSGLFTELDKLVAGLRELLKEHLKDDEPVPFVYSEDDVRIFLPFYDNSDLRNHMGTLIISRIEFDLNAEDAMNQIKEMIKRFEG